MEWVEFSSLVVLGAILCVGVALRIVRKRPPGPGEQELDRELTRYVSAECKRQPPPTPQKGDDQCCQSTHSSSHQAH